MAASGSATSHGHYPCKHLGNMFDSGSTCSMSEPETPDKFVWKWSPSQQHSAGSSYCAFFHGQCGVLGAEELSKARAIHHLLLGCVYIREVWLCVLRNPKLHSLTPGQETSLTYWLIRSCKLVHKESRRVFDTLVILVAWMIWREPNGQVFNSTMKSTAQLAAWIREEGRQWVLAG
jgi:hypothetical protein